MSSLEQYSVDCCESCIIKSCRPVVVAVESGGSGGVGSFGQAGENEPCKVALDDEEEGEEAVEDKAECWVVSRRIVSSCWVDAESCVITKREKDDCF